MRHLIRLIALLLLFSAPAWADNPAPAFWQGRPHTSGDGVMLFNSGQGVTIQDAGKTSAKANWPFGLDLTGSTLTISGSSQRPGNTWLNEFLSSVTGTYTGANHTAVNSFVINSYNVTRSSTGGVRNMLVYSNVGGASQTGGFINFDSTVLLNSNTADITSPFYQSANFSFTANANSGGGSGTEQGGVFGMGAGASLGPNATFYRGIAGGEFDLSAQTGSSLLFETGVSVVLLANNAVAASVESEAFLISMQGGSTATLNCGICFTGFNGFNALASGASIMKLFPHGGSGSYPQASITDGIDLHLFAFSGFAFRGANDTAQIDGSGNFITSANFQAAGTGVATLGNVTHGVGFRITDPGGAIVNILTIGPGATGGVVSYTCGGPLSDTNVVCGFASKGTGQLTFSTGGGKQFQIANVASAVDFIQASGSAAGSPGVVSFTAGGSDTDISIALVPKGAGVIKIGSTAGVTCSGTPTASFASTGGIVTHC